MKNESDDLSVIQTNDDAASCKLSLHSLGYINDTHLELFTSLYQGFTKPPIINRGYFGRVYTIHKIIEEFSKINDKNCQILNLGAGFDTSFWKFKTIPFIEMDFEFVVQKKSSIIKKHKELNSLLKNYEIKESKKQFILKFRWRNCW
jgi:hypothetical protein